MYEPAILRRLLFLLATTMALALLVFVFVAPWLDDGSAERHDSIALFARDATLRRTCIASAVGLIVTACIFFRRRRPPAPRRPPSGITGA